MLECRSVKLKYNVRYLTKEIGLRSKFSVSGFRTHDTYILNICTTKLTELQQSSIGTFISFTISTTELRPTLKQQPVFHSHRLSTPRNIGSQIFLEPVK